MGLVLALSAATADARGRADSSAGGRADGSGDDSRVTGIAVADFDFAVPDELSAHEPAEARGVRRDQVRMLVGRRSGLRLSHHVAADLPEVLRPGDLLVVNNSGTLPAALEGRLPDGTPVALHVSSAEPGAGGEHLVELRQPWHGTTKPFEDGVDARVDASADGSGTGAVAASPARTGLLITLPGGATARLTAEFTRRLWHAQFRFPSRGGEPGSEGILTQSAVAQGVAAQQGPVAQDTVTEGAVARGVLARESMARYLARYGKPIRYSYVDRDWPLSAYQTTFAVEPGSSEMPSAARPFTPELVTALVSRGILIAPITLHTGVASPEAHEAPYAERFRVPESTAWLVNHVRASGGRVIAVGTTVVRALESAVDSRTGTGTGAGVGGEGYGDSSCGSGYGEGRNDGGGEGHGDSSRGDDSGDDDRGGYGGGRGSGGSDTGVGKGVVRAADGWTDLVITPERGVRVVDGLLTGWHEPRASHLLMLEAVAGRPLLDLCYAEAIRARYLWHEFGDVNLLLNDD